MSLEQECNYVPSCTLVEIFPNILLVIHLSLGHSEDFIHSISYFVVIPKFGVEFVFHLCPCSDDRSFLIHEPVQGCINRG